MSDPITGKEKAVRLLHVLCPVTAVLCVAAAGLCGAIALDLSVRGGYFYSGSALPWLFYALFILCGGTVTAHALLSCGKSDGPAQYFTLPPHLALMPALGILLCLFWMLRPFTPTAQSIASLVCLCGGLVYFPTYLTRDPSKTYRFIAGLLFLLWPVVSFIYSFTDWYVPLNSPSKLLYQFALLALALFICEELRAASGADNGRKALLSAALCAVTSASAAAFLLMGNVTYPVAGSDGPVYLLICAAIYAGARWHALSSHNRNTPGAYVEDGTDVSAPQTSLAEQQEQQAQPEQQDQQTQQTEDNAHAG